MPNFKMVVLKNRLDIKKKKTIIRMMTMVLERCPFTRSPEQLDKSCCFSPSAQLSAGFVIETSASTVDQAAPLTAAG